MAAVLSSNKRVRSREPIAADRDIRKEQRINGRFRFLDPSYSASFLKYFTENPMHVFLDEADGAEAMERLGGSWTTLPVPPCFSPRRVAR